MKVILKYVKWFSIILLFLLYLPDSVYGRNESFSELNHTEKTEFFHSSPDLLFQEAQQLYLAGRALRDTLDMHSALIRLGRLYLDKYDPDEALNYFNRSLVLVKDQRSFICQEGESRYYIGLGYYNKHAFNLAMNWWNNGKKILTPHTCPSIYSRIIRSAAEYHLLMGDFIIAKEQLLEALDLISHHTEPELSVKIYTALGQVYHRLGDYDSSMTSYYNAIEICYVHKMKKILSIPLIHLSLTHCFYNEFDDAADNLQMVLQIAEEFEDLNSMGMAFSIMGIVEFIFQNYSRGLDYCNQALDIFNKTDNLVWQAQTHEHLFLLYLGLDDHISAEREAFKTLELRRKIGSDYGLGESYENLGLLYLAMEQYEQAKHANLKSLEFRTKINYHHGMASSLHKVGRTYYIMGNPDSAMIYLNKGLEIANFLNVKRGKAAILFTMSQVHESLGNTEDAYKIFKYYTALKDTIFNQAQMRKIEGFKRDLDIRNRERMISEQAQKITLQQISLVGLVFMLILLIILAWRLGLVMRKVRKSYKELSDRDALIHTYSNTIIRDKQEAEKQIEILDKTLFDLERMKQQLNWLFQLNIAGIALVNRNEILIKVNKYLADNLNYSVSELVGLSWEKICDPEDFKLEKDFLYNSIESGTTDFSMEIRLIRKNGSVLKTRLTVHIMKDIKGDFEFAMYLFQDITYQRFFDNKMLFHQNYLKRLLYLMTLEVDNLTQDIRQLASLSSGDRQSGLLVQITRNLQNSLGMVDKIRLLQDSFILEPGERFIDLAEIANVSALDFPETSIRVSGHGVAFADKSVRYVFHHIIRNAIHHGHAEKVKITIRQSGEYIQVMIVDNGRGITDAERNDVLNAYLHPDRSPYPGIGLYWVRQYVELHGGGLKIQRAKEKGTVVILLFLSKDSLKVPL